MAPPPDEPPGRAALDAGDRLALWVFLSEQVEELKARRWNTATLFIAVVGGLIGYAFEKPAVALRGGGLEVLDHESLILLCVLGLAVSAFNLWLIGHFNGRIRRERRRADFVAGRIAGLRELLAEADRGG